MAIRIWTLTSLWNSLTPLVNFENIRKTNGFASVGGKLVTIWFVIGDFWCSYGVSVVHPCRLLGGI